MPYAEALDLQRRVAQARIGGRLQHDVLLLVEHPPVVTLGRSSRSRNLLASPALLARRGVELFEVERGGDVTFHGPGQLVGYPILNLRQHRQDLHWYLRQIEATLIGALAAYGLSCGRRAGYTGVWTAQGTGRPPAPDGAVSGAMDASTAPIHGRKIASIGVHARDWVTWHGFALNVSTDLSYFDLVVPCGIDGVVMTSIERETGVTPSVADAGRNVARALGEVFGLTLEPHDASALFAALAS